MYDDFMGFWYVWGPVIVAVLVLVGLIVLAMRRKAIFLAIVSSVGVAFILPVLITNILHMTGLLPPSSGGSIPLPNNYVDLIFLLYFVFPIPLTIPSTISILLYTKYFSKKFRDL